VTGSAVYLKGGIILPGLTPWHVAADAGKPVTAAIWQNPARRCKLRAGKSIQHAYRIDPVWVR
jgi:hypothetical protein